MVPARWRLLPSASSEAEETASGDQRKAPKMSNLVDYMLDLYRNPDAAQAFIDDPNKALSDAGFPNVTPAQLQAVAAAAAPANVELSGGDPFSAVQQAVAEIHRPEPADDRFSVGYSPAEFDESAGPGPEESVDPVGGESLLLPYFEVDLDETAGPTDAEAWAQTQAQADGRFGVGFDATGEAGPTGIEPIEPAPGGETLLLPYFEVDSMRRRSRRTPKPGPRHRHRRTAGSVSVSTRPARPARPASSRLSQRRAVKRCSCRTSRWTWMRRRGRRLSSRRLSRRTPKPGPRHRRRRTAGSVSVSTRQAMLPHPHRSRHQRRWGKQRKTCPMGSFMGITSSRLRRRPKSRLSRPPTRVRTGWTSSVSRGLCRQARVT